MGGGGRALKTMMTTPLIWLKKSQQNESSDAKKGYHQ